jgi:predicted small lipoprotein YifL
MRTRLTSIVVAAAILLALGLAGCGQKGPLVPPKALTVAVTPSFIC